MTQSCWWSISTLIDKTWSELKRKLRSGQQICCLRDILTSLNSIHKTETAFSVSTETVRQPWILICPALGVLQPPANESCPLYDPPSNHSESEHKCWGQGMLWVRTSWTFFVWAIFSLFGLFWFKAGVLLWPGTVNPNLSRSPTSGFFLFYSVCPVSGWKYAVNWFVKTHEWNVWGTNLSHHQLVLK